jgi:enoyl-CoA hydratase/carnithine racemase
VGPSIYDIVPRLMRWPVPVVAAVGGPAVGGGFGLALAADFRVVATPAYFLANFTRLGITPGFGMSVTLPSLIGMQKAADVLYSSRRIGAKEAVLIGLADRCVGVSELDEQAEAFAAEIALGAPAAVAAIRSQVRSPVLAGLADALERERSMQERLMATEDFREGIQAWRERRPPEFKDD